MNTPVLTELKKLTFTNSRRERERKERERERERGGRERGREKKEFVLSARFIDDRKGRGLFTNKTQFSRFLDTRHTHTYRNKTYKYASNYR